MRFGLDFSSYVKVSGWTSERCLNQRGLGFTVTAHPKNPCASPPPRSLIGGLPPHGGGLPPPGRGH